MFSVLLLRLPGTERAELHCITVLRCEFRTSVVLEDLVFTIYRRLKQLRSCNIKVDTRTSHILSIPTITLKDRRIGTLHGTKHVPECC